MFKHKWKLILVFILTLFFLTWFFQSVLFRIRPRVTLSGVEIDLLKKEAALSLQSSDVPVGAILVYGDSVLSSGHNTVYLDSNAGGHAEINAISNAIRKIGFRAFSKLDRNQLTMISTFEPCMMCRGAIIENRIHHLYFMKEKGFFHWIKNDLKQSLYEWNKKQSEGEAMQDSLFRLHPDFRE